MSAELVELTRILRYLLGMTGVIMGLLIFLTYQSIRKQGIETWLDSVEKQEVLYDFKIFLLGHLAMTGGFLVYVYAGYASNFQISNVSRLTSLVFSTSLIFVFYRWWKRTL